MPIISAAPTNLPVTSRSSRLGSTLPLGWLCARITLAALARIAGLKTSRGWTRDAESVPTEIVGNSITSFLVFKSTATKFSRSRLAIRPLKRPSTSSGDDITGRPGLRTLPSLLPNSTAARIMHALASPIPCNPSKSCIEAPCNPKRSPLSEITRPASSTAVLSLVPVPNRIPSNSALESASGPSESSRSRGLSSGGSCLMVYLRPSTYVFYFIREFGSLTSSCVGRGGQFGNRPYRGSVRADGSWVWDSCVGEHSGRQGQGESHDVGVIAPDPLDEGCGSSLHGVSPGLADTLSVADVGLDLGGVEGTHSYPGHGVAQGEVLAPRDGYARVDFVRASL